MEHFLGDQIILSNQVSFDIEISIFIQRFSSRVDLWSGFCCCFQCASLVSLVSVVHTWILQALILFDSLCGINKLQHLR